MTEAGARVTGLDMSKGLLEEARKRSPAINFVEGDITRMQFPNASFDGVWSHASLVHLEKIEDVEMALSEFARVLKPDGALHIFVKIQAGDEKTAIVSDTLSNHDRFFRYYTPGEMKILVEKAGFKSVEIELHDDPHGRQEVQWIALFARKA
jgi:ubiquinone/menaquinone biosynthesis C-methylase UbiE